MANNIDRKFLSINKWKLILVSNFIACLILVSMIPYEVSGSTPPTIDSGNYVDATYDRIAYYNFNYLIESEYTYKVHDDSGRDKFGTVHGCTQVDERDGNILGNAALSFDGDDYIVVDDNDDFDFAKFVVATSILVSSEQVDHIICSKFDSSNEGHENGFYFYIDDGKLGFSVWDDGTESNIYDSDGDDLTLDGEWHFVAFESHNGTYSLFIDPTTTSNGVVETTSSSLAPGPNGVDFYIGRLVDDYFKGSMDFIYAYEIPQSVVFEPYISNRMWGNENVGYWPLDEGILNEDENFINDMVRYDYHSYGTVCGDIDSVTYVSAKPNGVPGSHAMLFTGGEDPGYIAVTDSNGYLQFYSDSYEDDLYIEFYFLTETYDGNQILIEKWDWGNYGAADGYRVYLEYNPLLSRSEVKFDVASTSIASITSSTQITNNVWYHVWAWDDGGAMYLYVDGYGSPTTASGPNTNGIGATSSPLFFGLGKPNSNFPCEMDWPFIGDLDDIVIGRCYPK